MDYSPSSLVFDNLKFYDSIKPKNPNGTYTVLATINEYKTGKLLALATGTQACLRNYRDDIEDCHAESLVKRAYKRYLINKVTSIISSSTSVVEVDHLIARDCSQDLILFISQFPCGLIRRYEGNEPVDKTTGTTIKRKPGRGICKDGETVYVEKDNCTTKLQKWIINGFQGDALKQVFKINSCIKRIIIGNCEPGESFDYESYCERLKHVIAPNEISKIQIDFLVENIRRAEFVFKPSSQPQPVALAWWLNSDSQCTALRKTGKRLKIENNGICELIVDGRKRSLTKKQCSSDNQSYKLKVANGCQRKDLANIEKLYRDLVR